MGWKLKVYHILKLNKIKRIYHRHDFIISSQSTFFGDFFATGLASPRSTTQPLQRVPVKNSFLVAKLCLLPCFTVNFTARFFADSSDLPFDVALQLCQILLVTLHPSNKHIFTASMSPSGVPWAPVASSGHFSSTVAVARRLPWLL